MGELEGRIISTDNNTRLATLAVTAGDEEITYEESFDMLIGQNFDPNAIVPDIGFKLIITENEKGRNYTYKTEPPEDYTVEEFEELVDYYKREFGDGE